MMDSGPQGGSLDSVKQVGIIAAGALYALLHHRERLAEDHANARRLASGLAEIPGIRLDCEAVDTNIVFFDVERGSALEMWERLWNAGVLILPSGPQTMRAVTSLAVDADGVDRAIDTARAVMAGA